MRCRACDAINARTRDACHHCHAPLHTVANGKAALAPAVPTGPVIPLLTHPGEEPVPLDWHLDLRFAELATEPMSLRSASSAPAPMVADPDAPRHAPPAPAPADAPADRAEAKARRRAAVRRAQQRRAAPAPPALRDVLVLEPDTAARAQLCAVLEAFGFRPHLAVSVAEAEGLSLRCQHVAAFLGLGEDVQPAAELCRRLRDTRRLRPTALIAIGTRERHADRVRLQLAGADQVLLRPVSRGDVARALEACGLGLPRDPRLGTEA
jgi:CheY-like chemotaxis protein